MKSLILITTIFLRAIIVNAQNYGFEDALVSTYQEKNPKEYQDNILNHAEDKWGDTNYTMVNLEVKHQIVAQWKIYQRIMTGIQLFSINGKQANPELEIVKKLILKWSYPGWADNNREEVSSEDFWYEDFKNVHCDWGMVLIDYDAILVIRNSKMD